MVWIDRNMDQLPDVEFYTHGTETRIRDLPHADIHNLDVMHQVRLHRFDLRLELGRTNRQCFR